MTAWVKELMNMDNSLITAEAYQVEGDETQIKPLKLNRMATEENAGEDYHLYQNIPNPFTEGTIIRFSLPKNEKVRVIVHDVTGRKVLEKEVEGQMGLNDVSINSQELSVQGVYYYTLQTLTANLTRKMSYTTF